MKLPSKKYLVQKRPRIPALDIMRGLFIVVLIVDHIAWQPSLFIQVITGKTFDLASAAEGFFAISGLLVGYVYGPRMLLQTKATFKKIWRRAFVLYILTVVLTFIYVAWSSLLPHPYPRLPWVSLDLPQLIFKTLTLQYSYGWSDFLSFYAVFMLFAPFALWLIVKGKPWIVAVASIAIWAIFPGHNWANPYSGWQIVFMLSMIIGYYLPWIEQFVKSLPRLFKTYSYYALLILTLISLFGFVLWYSFISVGVLVDSLHPHIAGPLFVFMQKVEIFRLHMLNYYFDRGDTLGIGRLLVGTVWFATFYLFLRKNDTKLPEWLKNLLLFFGKNSLVFFVIQGLVIFLGDVLFPAPATAGILVNTIVGILITTVIYFLVVGYNKAVAHAKKLRQPLEDI